MKGLSLGPKNLSHFDITTQFQHLFFLGDLNYRLEGIEPTVRNIIRFFQKQVHLKCSCEISLVFFFRCTSRNICDLFIYFLEFNSRFKHLLAIIYSQQIINKVSQLEKSRQFVSYYLFSANNQQSISVGEITTIKEILTVYSFMTNCSDPREITMCFVISVSIKPRKVHFKIEVSGSFGKATLFINMCIQF